MQGDQRITPLHLERRAIVYLRQSTEGQVLNNLESQRLQYAMADRAKALGFHDVEIIDVDLGASAAIAARRREGFERMLGVVALGQIGLVLSREVSRLSRTDKDFCQLIEVCQLFGTLIGDEEAIYDVRRTDDQLVLGIKGTMSVVELNVLRMRLARGKQNKAQRGELYPKLPPGYVWDDGTVVKDPNVRVQEAIAILFSKFRETWSIRQTFLWFRDNDVQLPANKSRGGKNAIVFKLPQLSFVSSVLHNPFYAGAYVWGRRPVKLVFRDGLLHKHQMAAVAPEKAEVFLRDHHEGYIDWATFEENERMIARNDWRGNSDETAGAVRAGTGLLSGLLRCGRCGRKLHVRYWGAKGTSPRYLCIGEFDVGNGRYCIGFGGKTADNRLGEEILRVLSPLGIRASIEALEQLGSQQDGGIKALQRQIQQLEYDTARSFEQYDQVDPRNRLVAAELERRWNSKLEELQALRARVDDLEKQRRALSMEERNALTALGQRFADVWNHADCPGELKKKILRTAIEEIVVDEDPPGTLAFIVHWKGGCHTAFQIPKPNPKTMHRTATEDVEIIRKMAPRYGDRVIAVVLNKLGRRTGKQKPWSQVAVKSARRKHSIEGHVKSIEDPEVLTLQGAVKHTGTSDTTIGKLVDAGVLPMRQAVPFAPWEIRRADLESSRVREILDRLRHSGRLVLNDSLKNQKQLFE